MRLMTTIAVAGGMRTPAKIVRELPGYRQAGIRGTTWTATLGSMSFGGGVTGT